MSSAPTNSTAQRELAFRTHVEPEIEVPLRVAQTLTGSWADAEGVVQDTLIRAHRAIEGFDGAHPRAWLYEIADLDGQRPAFGAVSVPNPEQAVTDRVLNDCVETALAALEAKFRKRPAADRRRPAHLCRDCRAARHPSRDRDVAADPRPWPGPHRPSFQPRVPEKPTMSSLWTMLTCHWSARRIQRYLDADPAALLEAGEVQRLEAHLATCQECAAAAAECGGVRRALARWSQRRRPDPAVTARVRLAAERLMAEDAP